MFPGEFRARLKAFQDRLDVDGRRELGDWLREYRGPVFKAAVEWLREADLRGLAADLAQLPAFLALESAVDEFRAHANAESYSGWGDPSRSEQLAAIVAEYVGKADRLHS
jgi:hypothetical protein